ncbi:MAG TPA: hypothetical protein VGP40_08740 [Chthoniobacterales bacterium]|nr:hypothetical protein [Chthoniobacterales bacterium]
MAEGKSYTCRIQYSIALLKNTAVIVVEEGLPHILPLLTITGISYLNSAASSEDGGDAP